MIVAIIIGFLWYLVSFTYCILSMQHTITYNKYRFNNSKEVFIVSCIFVCFCWLMIPAELVYSVVKEKENSGLDDNVIDDDLLYYD